MKPDILRARLDRNIPETKLAQLESTFLWKNILLGTMTPRPAGLLEALNIQKTRGAVFTGVPGNGRHTTAYALIGSTCNPKLKNPPHYLRITGWDLDCEQRSSAYALIDSIVEIARECGSLCLLLDRPEDSRHSKAVQSYLAENLQTEPALSYLVVISEKPEMIDYDLFSLLKHCPCHGPFPDQHKEWLSSQLDNANAPITTEMELDNFFRDTESFTWKQLNELIGSMRQLLARKYFERFKSYSPDSAENDILCDIEEGSVTLTEAETANLIHSIRTQILVAPSGNISYIPIPGQMPPAPIRSGTTPESEEFDMQKAQEFITHHRSPKDMTYEQLMNLSY